MSPGFGPPRFHGARGVEVAGLGRCGRGRMGPGTGGDATRRIDLRGAQGIRVAVDRATGTGSPRALLRADRLDRRRRPDGETCGGDPHVLVGEGAPNVRYRRGYYLRLRPRTGVGGDGTQSRPPGAPGVELRAASGKVGTMIVWFDGSLRPPARASSTPWTTASPWVTAFSRPVKSATGRCSP